MAEDRLPPHNLDAEESVLGAMLISKGAIDAVLEHGLRAGDFYRHSHALIFSAITNLHSAGEAADHITVADHLDQDAALKEAGGAARINDLANLVPATGNVLHYAEIVAEMARLRYLIILGEKIQRLGWERSGTSKELLDQAAQMVFNATTHDTRTFIELGAAVHGTFNEMQRLHHEGREIVGLPTGFYMLDQYTSGLQGGNLIVLASRPSMGKSALSLGISKHAAMDADTPTLIFTLEMNHREVAQRFLSLEASISSQKLRNGDLVKEEWQRATDAAAKFGSVPVLIDEDSMLTTVELAARARRVKQKIPELGLIVVDYLQLINSGVKTDNRVQDVSATSRMLKVLAGELDVPVLALSQLNRAVEQRHDKRPLLSDLRDSGSIEQDADVVLLLYRDDYYNEDEDDSELRGIAELNIAKHRNGPTGVVKLSFVERYAKFANLA